MFYIVPYSLEEFWFNQLAYSNNHSLPVINSIKVFLKKLFTIKKF